MAKLAVLVILYWGGDGRNSIDHIEYASMASCVQAEKLVHDAFDGFHGRSYTACTEK